MNLIENQEEVNRRLLDSSNRSEKARVWIRGIDHVVTFDALLIGVCLATEILEVQINSDADIEKIQLNDEVKLHLSDSSAFIFTKIKMKTVDGKLHLFLPDHIVLENRRKSERLDAHPKLIITMLSDKNTMRKNAFDFSLGGVSVVLNKTEYAKFKGEIETISMTFYKKTIEIPVRLKVVELVPFAYENIPYGKARLSFIFQDLSPKDRSMIKLIYNECQKFLIKAV